MFRSVILVSAGLFLTTAAQAQEIGVPACDAFYKSYEACVATKIPEAQRATFKQQLDAGKASMRQAGANPQAKAALEQSCTMQKQQMSQALASYGCKWD
ncbi:MAG: hypothetical protein ACRDBH_12600 [Bosea sp. (in: a-proteobacteria)]